jgi:hypothetical protein
LGILVTGTEESRTQGKKCEEERTYDNEDRDENDTQRAKRVGGETIHEEDPSDIDA